MAKTKEKNEVTPEVKVKEINKDLVNLEEQKSGVAVIKNEVQLQEANEFLVTVKGRLNRINELIDGFNAPHQEIRRVALESMNKNKALFQEAVDSLGSMEKAVKRAMSDYRIEQDKIAKAKEDEDRKKREEQLKTGSPAPIVPKPSVPVPQKTLNTDDGGRSSAKKVVKFEIEDANAIPKKYKDLVYAKAIEKGLLDQVIRDAVKLEGMNTNIKGVRVFEDYDISVRA